MSLRSYFFFILALLNFSACTTFQLPQAEPGTPAPTMTRMGFEEEDHSKEERFYELQHPEVLQSFQQKPEAQQLLALIENEHRMGLDSVALVRLKHKDAASWIDDTPQLKMLLAEIYFNLGLYDSAEKHYLELLKPSTNTLLIRWRLFSSYEKLQSYDKALAQLQELQAMEPDRSFVHYKRGKILAAMKKEDAEREFQQAIQLKPDFKSAHLELANLWMEEDRFEESTKLLSKLERKYGPDFDVHKLAGEASLRSGDLEDAEKRFLTLSQSGSYGLEAYKKLSEVYEQQNNLPRKAWALNEALEIDTADDQLRLQLTETYIRNNQVVEAQKYALEISPQSELYVDGQMRLIQYFESQQDMTSALTKKQQLAMKFPEHPKVREWVSLLPKPASQDPTRSPANSLEMKDVKDQKEEAH